jgi:shikimate kinase
MSRVISNLCLAGFMGTGKSTIGRMSAESLQYPLIDTDHWIESAAGKTIAEIFQQEGEAAFRAWERKAVAELAGKRDCVISTGGGLIADTENLASLKVHSLVVCLWASPEAIFERVKDQTHRPLLHSPDPLGKIRELLAGRMPAYRQADVLINTEDRHPREVAFQVLHHFRDSRDGTAV